MRESRLARFERRVQPEPNSGCWLWTGAVRRSGYGAFCWSTAEQGGSAHTAAWQLYRGLIGGQQVLHRCHVRSCVNPEHLYLGSHADNMADRQRAGRQVHGERHGQSKLTAADVDSIRAATGRLSDIAAAHGCSISAVWHIRNRLVWRHIK